MPEKKELKAKLIIFFIISISIIVNAILKECNHIEICANLAKELNNFQPVSDLIISLFIFLIIKLWDSKKTSFSWNKILSIFFFIVLFSFSLFHLKTLKNIYQTKALKESTMHHNID